MLIRKAKQRLSNFTNLRLPKRFMVPLCLLSDRYYEALVDMVLGEPDQVC